MTSILILGGTGQTGRLLVAHLLASSTVSVTVATRHLDASRAFATEMNRRHPGERVTAVHADAADAASLHAAFRGHDLVVVAAPTTAYAANVVPAVLEAGAGYLDVQLSASKLDVLRAASSDIERAGRCFITEAGFHPGLPSALVRYAASQMDTIASATVACYLNMGNNLPYTEAVDELIELFKDYQNQVLADSRWIKPSSFAMRDVTFAADIGRRRCYPMFFEELRQLPDMYPSLHDLGFYMSESHWITDFVVMPITWLWLTVMPGAVRPIGRFLWWGMGTFHKPPYRVELQVQARGVKAGRPVSVRATVAHPDGYELTAIPVVATLLQYLDGTARRPGLHLMGHLVEPHRLMRDMEAMGVRVVTRVS